MLFVEFPGSNVLITLRISESSFGSVSHRVEERALVYISELVHELSLTMRVA